MATDISLEDSYYSTLGKLPFQVARSVTNGYPEDSNDTNQLGGYPANSSGMNSIWYTPPSQKNDVLPDFCNLSANMCGGSVSASTSSSASSENGVLSCGSDTCGVTSSAIGVARGMFDVGKTDSVFKTVGYGEKNATHGPVGSGSSITAEARFSKQIQGDVSNNIETKPSHYRRNLNAQWAEWPAMTTAGNVQNKQGSMANGACDVAVGYGEFTSPRKVTTAATNNEEYSQNFSSSDVVQKEGEFNSLAKFPSDLLSTSETARNSSEMLKRPPNLDSVLSAAAQSLLHSPCNNLDFGDECRSSLLGKNVHSEDVILSPPIWVSTEPNSTHSESIHCRDYSPAPYNSVRAERYCISCESHFHVPANSGKRLDIEGCFLGRTADPSMLACRPRHIAPTASGPNPRHHYGFSPGFSNGPPEGHLFRIFTDNCNFDSNVRGVLWQNRYGDSSQDTAERSSAHTRSVDIPPKSIEGHGMTMAVNFSPLKMSPPTPTKGCVFCKNNGYHASFCRSHSLKDEHGNCTCPVLRTYVCPLCRGTGNFAHTLKYCPLNTVTRGDPIAAGLPPGKVTNWKDVASKMNSVQTYLMPSPQH